MGNSDFRMFDYQDLKFNYAYDIPNLDGSKGISRAEMADLQTKLKPLLTSTRWREPEEAKKELGILMHHQTSPVTRASAEAELKATRNKLDKINKDIEKYQAKLDSYKEDMDSTMWHIGAFLGLTEYDNDELKAEIAQAESDVAYLKREKAKYEDKLKPENQNIISKKTVFSRRWDDLETCGEEMGKTLSSIDTNKDGYISASEVETAKSKGIVFGRDILGGKDKVQIMDIVEGISDHKEYTEAARRAING